MTDTRLASPDVDTLLSKAEPAVRAELAEIGDFILNAETLPVLRAEEPGERPVLSDAVERTDHLVPGPDGAPEFIVRIHRPKAASGDLPCVYSIHGGGYVLGDHLGNDRLFDDWCPRLGCVGVSVNYRRAPETPFPGALDDCYAGLQWIYEHAGELGIAADRIGVMGGSAGGGLAACLALLARDRGELPLAFQLLLYPMLDDRQSTPSSQVPTPIWGPENNRFAWVSYLAADHGTDNVSQYAAAARADDLTGLPPTLIVVGDVDGLLDEDIDYARRLLSAGVPTDLHVVASGPHAFDDLMPAADVTARTLHILEEWLAGHFVRR